MNPRISDYRNDFTDNYRTFTTSDGITLFLRAWEPSMTHAKDTAVLILHGITAHSGPYEIIGIPLSESGFPTFGLDLRGHGLSDGNRGDTPGSDRFTKDLCETVSYLKETYSQIVLVGHSLGVFQAAIILNTCLDGIVGAVLLSGARTVMPGAITPLSFYQKFKIGISSLISPSKPVIEYRRENMVGLDDPLFTFMYTLRFLRMVDLDGMVFPENLDIPMFVGVGNEDEMFSVDAVKALFDELPSNDKEFYVLPGARHAVFPEGTFQLLIDWMNERFT